MTATSVLALAILTSGSIPAFAQYRYSIRDDGFAIHNGPAYFNRPLFGTHEPSMLLSGDRPAFAYFAPIGLGKIGTMYLGVVTWNGGKWLHEFADIESVYQPGLTRHVLADPILSGGSLEITAVPLSTAEGFTLRLQWIKRPSEPVRLVWVFGGASGYNTNKSANIDKLNLSSEDTVRNVIDIWGSRFSLTSPTMNGREILGTTDLPGSLASKDVSTALRGPLQAEHAPPSKTSAVVFAGNWSESQNAVHLLFTLAGAATLEQLARNPAETFDQCVRFYREMANRVTVKTPDPHFDLAVQAMVVANDALWRPPAFTHGAMSWMQHYLGWRTWYGSEALGWHDRVRSSIMAHAARQLHSGDNRGALPSMLEDPRSVYYNMNEVFLDDVYYHYIWTGDRPLLASLFPVIEGILTWEKNRLDPDDNALYEGCLNTWISDSHWYSGGDSTQASAYMFRGYQLAAEAAEAAGKDPKPFREESERIRQAMNQKLWLSSRGHYAEFIDRLGLKRVHPEPELPTIYHPIDFGVTDQMQAYQMLRFTETNLRNESGIPGGGRLVWSSNWAPNYNGNYTHSTNDLVFAEQLNLAIAYYRAGQFDKAYEIMKGTYASMYMGGIPGGLSCQAYPNGQQRRNEEFGDAVSMFARTAVEGVFGILPELQHGVIHISPGFPKDWAEASIRTPDLSYRFHKTGTEIAIDLDAAQPALIHYRVPVQDARVLGVTVDDTPADIHVEPGIGLQFVDVRGKRGTRSTLRIRIEPRKVEVSSRSVATPGERVLIHAAGLPAQKVNDPQGVLDHVQISAQSAAGTTRADPGPHTAFLLLGADGDSIWEPVNFEVRPPLEILDTRFDANSGRCEFVLRNNTAGEIRGTAKTIWAGRTTAIDVALAAGGQQQFHVEGNMPAVTLGKNHLEISGLGAGTVAAVVSYWPQKPDGRKAEGWHLLPLDKLYNDSLATVLSRSFWTTEYSYATCRDYMLVHLNGARSKFPNDLRLRAKVNGNGILNTQSGVPFAQRAEGNNIVALSRWHGFPSRITVPVGHRGKKIYLLLSGLTFPMQSHIANARITVHYEGGGTSTLDLVNPTNFDNGWGAYGGTYHYTANGMEVIGEEHPDPPAPEPLTILHQHDAPPDDRLQEQWDNSVAGRVPFPPHADIVDIDCDPARTVNHVEIEVLSNEIILALFGVTFQR